jgi:hypothetical protein
MSATSNVGSLSLDDFVQTLPTDQPNTIINLTVGDFLRLTDEAFNDGWDEGFQSAEDAEEVEGVK